MSPKRRHRERHDDQRPSREQEQRAQEAQRQVRYRKQRRRRALATVLFIVAGVLAVSHVFEHFGAFQVMSPGLEDLLIGWPMAGALAVVAGIMWGA